jgi:hypothetical protein
MPTTAHPHSHPRVRCRCCSIDIKLTEAYSMKRCRRRECFTERYEAGMARVNRPIKSIPDTGQESTTNSFPNIENHATVQRHPGLLLAFMFSCVFYGLEIATILDPPLAFVRRKKQFYMNAKSPRLTCTARLELRSRALSYRFHAGMKNWLGTQTKLQHCNWACRSGAANGLPGTAVQTDIPERHHKQTSRDGPAIRHPRTHTNRNPITVLGTGTRTALDTSTPARHRARRKRQALRQAVEAGTLARHWRGPPARH